MTADLATVDGVTWLVAALVIIAVLLSGAVVWLATQRDHALDQIQQLTTDTATWPQVCRPVHPEDLDR